MFGLAVGVALQVAADAGKADRVLRTAAILERRGYAATPTRLAHLCLGGPVDPAEVLDCLGPTTTLQLASGLVVSPSLLDRAPAIAERARSHQPAAAAYLPAARRFVSLLVALNPYILSVSIAGSLASGGFRPADDIDFNLVVEDGRRHLAYTSLNLLGYLHALHHRKKPVDAHSRRPLAPRLMTANLILERLQCDPLARQDEDMAFELLQSQPVFGADLVAEIIEANPQLAAHFPQLCDRPPVRQVEPRRRVPGWLWPRLADVPARWIGGAAWRYMQWTRRRSPEALARVAYVRSTMRPYALFDSGP
jgi:hypothetical protein